MSVTTNALSKGLPTDDPSLRKTSIDRKNKRRQADKIKSIGQVLSGLGYRSLSEQAEVLGLGRSTTWTLVKAKHKASGLSATLINRMLTAPRLPHPVRAILLEYVEEKAAGLYGDGRTKIGRFMDRLAAKPVTSAQNSLGRRA